MTWRQFRSLWADFTEGCRKFLKMNATSKVLSVCVLVIVLAVYFQHAEAQPTKFRKWSEYVKARGWKIDDDHSENKCRHGGPTRDLCESCTKLTKNEVVYPLCCEDKENVRGWCKKFLEYKFIEWVERLNYSQELIKEKFHPTKLTFSFEFEKSELVWICQNTSFQSLEGCYSTKWLSSIFFPWEILLSNPRIFTFI